MWDGQLWIRVKRAENQAFLWRKVADIVVIASRVKLGHTIIHFLASIGNARVVARVDAASMGVEIPVWNSVVIHETQGPFCGLRTDRTPDIHLSPVFILRE